MRMKPHVLSAEMEALLADAGEMASSPDNIYSKFNNADLKFLRSRMRTRYRKNNSRKIHPVDAEP